MKKVDGWYFQINPDHELFQLPKPKKSPLETYSANTSNVTTHEVMKTWLQSYRDMFEREYDRSPYDLVRYRYVLRKLGGVKTLQAIKDFMQAYRNAPGKITTLRFYNQYGRRK